MSTMLDTNVIVSLRDGEARVRTKFNSLSGDLIMSVITRVELESGIYRDPAQAARRRARVNEIVQGIPTIPFDDAAAEAYGRIVAHAGYSRRKLLDRMIAAQALVHRAELVTLNPADFADVPGLEVIGW